MENYYGKLLSDKKLTVLPVAHDPSIENELETLDKSYKELKNELPFSYE